MPDRNEHMSGGKESDFYFSDREGRLLINADYPNWIQDLDDSRSMRIVLSEEKQRELYSLLKKKFEASNE